MAGALDRFAPGSSAGYQRFFDLSARLHRISERWFFWRPVGGMRDMFDFKSSLDRTMLGDVLAMRMGRSVACTVRRHMPDARVAQMMDHFTQYVGSAPDQSPAVLCGIAHMQTDEGIWYPMGGTRAVPAGARSARAELGVEIRHRCQVADASCTEAGA